jgi:hypothetical protein
LAQLSETHTVIDIVLVSNITGKNKYKALQ